MHLLLAGAMAQAEGPGTDLETYLAKMSKPSTWAGWPELVAIEELCDRRIELFDSDSFALLGGPRVQPRSIHFAGELPLEELMGVTPLRLSFHGNSHYNSVQPSESKEVELLGTRGSGDTDPVSPPLGMRTTGVIRCGDEVITFVSAYELTCTGTHARRYSCIRIYMLIRTRMHMHMHHGVTYALVLRILRTIAIAIYTHYSYNVNYITI